MRLALNPYKRLGGRRHAVAMFDRPGAAVDAARGMSGWAHTAQEMEHDRAFYSDTWEGMARAAISGSETFAAQARALEKQIAGVALATPKRAIVESPFGRPSVGAYLARDPMPCRRSTTIKTTHAPLSIVVSVNSRADVKLRTMQQRGIAIAALVQSVALQRPVNLYISRFCSCDFSVDTNILVRFPTAPMDSRRLAYLLASQAFARGLFFALHRSGKDIFAALGDDTAKNVSRSGMIGPAGGDKYSQARLCPFADDLQDYLRSDVLYIPGAYPGIGDFDAMKADPVSWINDTVATLTKGRA